MDKIKGFLSFHYEMAANTIHGWRHSSSIINDPSERSGIEWRKSALKAGIVLGAATIALSFRATDPSDIQALRNTGIFALFISALCAGSVVSKFCYLGATDRYRQERLRQFKGRREP